jgi:pimeloyl-ACP methyl ester carboxylesterase
VGSPPNVDPVEFEGWVDVGGYRLWVRRVGADPPTVVFESGGGDDSSVWTELDARTRAETGVATVVYDRAGLGRSDPCPGPYRIENESTGLRTALTAAGAISPFVLVAHSYGGFVSVLTAATDPRVAGLVLLDANLAEFFDDAEIARLTERFEAVFPEFERKAPQVASVVVPSVRAMPDTVRSLRAVDLPLNLPVVDIVAERTWLRTPEEVAGARAVHAAFVSASPAREAVFAAGSGHYVMTDRPDLAIDAISRVVGRVRLRRTEAPAPTRAR